MTTGIMSVGGVDLHYVREGAGLPLMVIGWSGYTRMFSTGLRRYFDMVFADCRHFVTSYRPEPEELNSIVLDTFVEEVEAVRREMRLERIAVLGHSVHAQIALAYASRYPQRVSHAVLVGGVPYNFEDLTPEQDRYWNEHASEARKAAFAHDQEAYAERLRNAPAEQKFGVFYLSQTAKYWANPEYDARALTAEIRVSAALDRLFSIVPRKAEVRDRLEKLLVPAVVFTGRHDYICPPTAWEGLTAGLSGIAHHCIEASSHNPQMEHPELFERALLDWFRMP